MFLATARALAALADPTDHAKGLLPKISQLREVSATVAVAVADAAIADGLNRIEVDNTIEAVREVIWSPTYVPILRQAAAAGPSH